MSDPTSDPTQPPAESTNPLVVFRVAATPLSRATIWAIGIYSVLQGLLILVVDKHRFAGPAYAIMRGVPGGTVTWGVLALLLGLLVLRASYRHHFVFKAVGLLGIAAWSLAFDVSLVLTSLSNTAVGTTGIPTYALVAVCASVVVWADERKPFHWSDRAREAGSP